jgi:hypothetical protein
MNFELGNLGIECILSIQSLNPLIPKSLNYISPKFLNH